MSHPSTDYFRPLFCDADPEKAAHALDDLTLMAQIKSVTLLVLSVENAVFHEWDRRADSPLEPDFEMPYTERSEDFCLVPSVLLTAYDFGARRWATNSEPAAKWLITHANALVTEAEYRGLKPDPALVKVAHCCFVRRDIYARTFRGVKRSYLPHYPSTEPNYVIEQRDRTLLHHHWAAMRDEPEWTGRTPPAWWAVRGILNANTNTRVTETLVDRSTPQV